MLKYEKQSERKKASFYNKALRRSEHRYLNGNPHERQKGDPHQTGDQHGDT